MWKSPGDAIALVPLSTHRSLSTDNDDTLVAAMLPLERNESGPRIHECAESHQLQGNHFPLVGPYIHLLGSLSGYLQLIRPRNFLVKRSD